jgi:hypothetical protein
LLEGVVVDSVTRSAAVGFLSLSFKDAILLTLEIAFGVVLTGLLAVGSEAAGLG